MTKLTEAEVSEIRQSKPQARMTEKQRELYYKLQRRAGGILHYAVKTGRLVNLKKTEVLCVDCGIRRATGYDHRDYSKPLDVAPVCGTCNKLRGPARIPQ